MLVTLAGCALGWLGVQVQWIRDRHALLDSEWILDYGLTPDAAPWPLRWLGAKGCSGAVMFGENFGGDPRRFAELFPEAKYTTIDSHKIPDYYRNRVNRNRPQIH